MTTITIDSEDLHSMAKAVELEVTNIKQLSDWLDIDLTDDCLVLEKTPIIATDGNAESEYDPEEFTQEQAAKDYADSFDPTDSTCWVTVYTFRRGIDHTGRIVNVGQESHTFTIEPDEPDCEEDHTHEWHAPWKLLGGLKDNPGVWGNGAGLIIKEVCKHCGCLRTTNTWAQNPENGEQGLCSVEYDAGWVAREGDAWTG